MRYAMRTTRCCLADDSLPTEPVSASFKSLSCCISGYQRPSLTSLREQVRVRDEHRSGAEEMRLMDTARHVGLNQPR